MMMMMKIKFPSNFQVAWVTLFFFFWVFFKSFLLFIDIQKITVMLIKVVNLENKKYILAAAFASCPISI